MRGKRILLIAIFVVVAGLIGLHFAAPFRFVDFPVYYHAGLSLLKGRTDIYAADFALSPLLDYRYPPLFLVLFSPLSLLPHSVAAYVWFWTCVLEIVACVWLVRRIIGQALNQNENAKFNWTSWILALLIVGQYFIIALKYGNAHLLVTALLFGSFYLLMRRKDGWAALLMSLAVTIKLIPLIALPYFALKRRWLFLSLTAVFLIALNLAPALYFGFDKNLELMRTWYETIVLDHESHEKDSWINLSLKGQLRRYLTEIDYSTRAIGTDNFDREYEQVNLISISQDASNRIWAVASFFIFTFSLLLIWFRARRDGNNGISPANAEHGERLLIEFSLIICLLLIIGPLTPKIYFIKLLLPAACLAAVIFNPARPAGKFYRRALLLIAGANLILPLLPGRLTQRYLLVLGTDFYLTLALMLVAVSLLFAGNRQGQTHRES